MKQTDPCRRLFIADTKQLHSQVLRVTNLAEISKSGVTVQSSWFVRERSTYIYD